MNKLVCLILAAFCLGAAALAAHAADEHGGIRFDMTQAQAEALGFSCITLQEARPDLLAVCRNKELRGEEFGIAATNYELQIGPGKLVDVITVTLTGLQVPEDVADLHRRIEQDFPNKDDMETVRRRGMFSRDGWRAKDNAGLTLAILFGNPAVAQQSQTVVNLMFYSRRVMAEVDRKICARTLNCEPAEQAK